MLPALKPRRYERVGLRSGPFVAWQGPAGCSVSRVATLGMGGLFIAAAEPAGIGEVIKMVFQILGGEVRARAIQHADRSNLSFTQIARGLMRGRLLGDSKDLDPRADNIGDIHGPS